MTYIKNKNRNSVAVLLSSYNGEKFIEEQIVSILKQSYAGNITIFIRDDGSTDNTLNIVNSLSSKHKNIVVLKGENIGLVKSYLLLLSYSLKKNFDYYAFCDQDDVWLPNKLINAISFLENNDRLCQQPLMYCCTSKVVDENLKYSGKTTQAKIRNLVFYNTAIQNICPGHNQIINKKLAKIIIDNTLYDPRIYSQDYWISDIASVVGKILFDNTPHTLYRMHGENELGYGQNKLLRMFDHLKRVLNQESRKMSQQLNYFTELFSQYLSEEQIIEVNKFFRSQHSFKKRFEYIRNTKFYRQNRIETTLFKILYLFGFYNIG